LLLSASAGKQVGQRLSHSLEEGNPVEDFSSEFFRLPSGPGRMSFCFGKRTQTIAPLRRLKRIFFTMTALRRLSRCSLLNPVTPRLDQPPRLVLAKNLLLQIIPE
jgi:hypothetical protein